MNIIVDTNEAIENLERLNVLPHAQRKRVLEEANRICDTVAPRPHLVIAIGRALASLDAEEATVLRALRRHADLSCTTEQGEA